MHTVGRQRDRLVLLRHPGPVTADAGRQHHERLVAEVDETGCLALGRVGLHELVDRTAKAGRGGKARLYFVLGPWGQGAIAEETDDAPDAEPSRRGGEQGSAPQRVVRARV